jgi:hypothetical protein
MGNLIATVENWQRYGKIIEFPVTRRRRLLHCTPTDGSELNMQFISFGSVARVVEFVPSEHRQFFSEEFIFSTFFVLPCLYFSLALLLQSYELEIRYSGEKKPILIEKANADLSDFRVDYLSCVFLI